MTIHHTTACEGKESNEAVEKPSQDIAPVMHMLQDFDIDILRSEVRDGPL